MKIFPKQTTKNFSEKKQNRKKFPIKYDLLLSLTLPGLAPRFPTNHDFLEISAQYVPPYHVYNIGDFYMAADLETPY